MVIYETTSVAIYKLYATNGCYFHRLTSVNINLKSSKHFAYIYFGVIFVFSFLTHFYADMGCKSLLLSIIHYVRLDEHVGYLY